MTFDYRTGYQDYRNYLKQLMRQAQAPAAKTSLAIVGTLLLAAFLAWVALKPTLVIVASLVRSISDEQAVLTALEAKTTSLQTAQTQLNVIAPKMSLANAAIPPAAEVETFIKEVEILAGESELKGLTIDQMGLVLNLGPTTADAQAAEKKVDKIDFNFSVGGSETAIRTFLDKLVNLDRLVVINSATLNDVSQNVSSNRPYSVEALVSASIFTTQKISLPSPKPLPPSGEAGSGLGKEEL